MPCYVGVTVTLATFSVHIGQWGGSVRAVLAAAATGVVFLFIAIVAGGQMGLGDVKLGGLIGLVTGGHGCSSVAHAAVAGFALAAVAGPVLILARRATARTHQPFGPYLLAGAFVTLML